MTGEDLAGADPHDERADETEQDDGGLVDQRDAGERAKDVCKKAVDTLGKGGLFARFGVVALDNADAAERFLETACNLALDLAAFLEQRPHAIEAKEHGGSDGDDDYEGEHGEQSAGCEKNGEGEDGGKQTAAEIDEAGADEVAKTFDVEHDAVYEFAGLVPVEIGDGETADVDLNSAAHFGDEALGGLGENLGDGEGTGGLNEGGRNDSGDERRQHFVAAFTDDVIDEELGGSREDKAGATADDDEDAADGELSAERDDDCEEVREEVPEAKHFC